jgi:hypothetical protein
VKSAQSAASLFRLFLTLFTLSDIMHDMRWQAVKMKLDKLAGMLVGLVLFALSLTVAGILCAYLTEYGEVRLIFAAGIVAAGAGVGVVASIRMSKHCRSKRSAVIIVALVAVLVLAPLASMIYPGRVIYSRFGLAVYGIMPVPILDITVGGCGRLWFRDKSHFISIDEVRALLSPDVEVLVIGNGWESAVRVDAAIEKMERIEVHVLPTPEAFDLFNRCVSEGRRVVLIAHSTC